MGATRAGFWTKLVLPKREALASMTAERFERPPEIAAELAALPGEQDAGYLDSLRSCRLEVLVIARRRTAAGALRIRIDEILVCRALPFLRAAVFRHGKVPPGELEDAQHEAMARFWEAIQAESFFEVRFNRAMKTLAQRAGERTRGGKQRERERSAERIGARSGGSDEGQLDIGVDDAKYAAIENRMLIEAGLSTLPDEQGRAISLHYLEGLPAFSQDPQVSTVASMLGWSERKTRQRLAEGRAALRLWIDRGEDDD